MWGQTGAGARDNVRAVERVCVACTGWSKLWTLGLWGSYASETKEGLNGHLAKFPNDLSNLRDLCTSFFKDTS